MPYDRITVFGALTVGLLCAAAGIWLTLTGGNLIASATLILISFVISGAVWKYLLDRYNNLKRHL